MAASSMKASLMAMLLTPSCFGHALEARQLPEVRGSRGSEKGTHNAVPARLTPAGDALVHHVVGDEEVGLELRAPETRTGTNGSAPSRARDRQLEARRGKVGRTSSMHHPRMAARLYSSSVRLLPLRISTVSTTEMPRLSLPARRAQGQRVRRAELA